MKYKVLLMAVFLSQLSTHSLLATDESDLGPSEGVIHPATDITAEFDRTESSISSKGLRWQGHNTMQWQGKWFRVDYDDSKIHPDGIQTGPASIGEVINALVHQNLSHYFEPLSRQNKAEVMVELRRLMPVKRLENARKIYFLKKQHWQSIKQSGWVFAANFLAIPAAMMMAGGV